MKVGLPTRTIFPLTDALTPSRYAVNSSWVGPCIALGFVGEGNVGVTRCTASAFTMPLVEGVQANTSNVSASWTGESIMPMLSSLTQPGWPKSHASRAVLSKPHDFISLAAHFAAFT